MAGLPILRPFQEPLGYRKAPEWVRRDAYPRHPQVYAGKLKCLSPYELAVVFHHCDVLDLIALRKTCLWMYCFTYQSRKLWKLLMRRICEEYEVPIGTFNFYDMSILEIQWRASIPELFIKRAKRKNYTLLGARSFRILRFPATMQIPPSVRPDLRFSSLHFAAGGQLLLAIQGIYIHLLDATPAHGSRMIEVAKPCRLHSVHSNDQIQVVQVDMWTPKSPPDVRYCRGSQRIKDHVSVWESGWPCSETVYVFVEYLRTGSNGQRQKRFEIYTLHHSSASKESSHAGCPWMIAYRPGRTYAGNPFNAPDSLRFACRRENLLWFIQPISNSFGVWNAYTGAQQFWDVGDEIQLSPDSSLVATCNTVLILGLNKRVSEDLKSYDRKARDQAMSVLEIPKTRYVIKRLQGLHDAYQRRPASECPLGRDHEAYDLPCPSGFTSGGDLGDTWIRPCFSSSWGTFAIAFEQQHSCERVYHLRDYFWRKLTPDRELDAFCNFDEEEPKWVPPDGPIFKWCQDTNPKRGFCPDEPLGKVKAFNGHMAYFWCDRNRQRKSHDYVGTRLRIINGIMKGKRHYWDDHNGFDLRLPAEPHDVHRLSVDFDPLSARYCYVKDGELNSVHIYDLVDLKGGRHEWWERGPRLPRMFNVCRDDA
ncbi:hypothetical protein BD626DRAFT_584615 [Schizophyllum amplum]|uniref:Uncharacterized protein n=1 Tax=Schizophyllum amplum TaxID=97359 RepID=A0A550C8W8_9AGAR|nr:hypothetical protein BD626DRAFT_584615 [Auriculariopsis ampla]